MENNPGEIQKLWKEFRQNKDDELRNRLIENYIPIVKYVAERIYCRLPPNVDLEDLASAGIFGLIDAINGYDINRGIKFETYCVPRIRGSILDELRSMDWVPRLVRSQTTRIQNLYENLERDLGRNPTDEEMAERLGVTCEEYFEMVREASAASLLPLGLQSEEEEFLSPENTGETIEDKGDSNPFHHMHRRDFVKHIHDSLNEQEKYIVLLYYFEELTMKEIGYVMEISESRVCQIHSRILLRLRIKFAKKRHELFS